MKIRKSNSDRDSNASETNLTQSPDPNDLRGSKWRRRLLLWGGSTLLLSLGGGFIYGWIFVQNRLVPLIEIELTDFLNRPVKLGSLKSISPVGARFGASEILATPNDPANVSIAAVDVTFNPFLLVAKRELQLNVTAIEPDIYLEQGKGRKWLVTKFDSPSGRPPRRFKVNLNALRLQDADVVLRGRSTAGQLQTPVAATIEDGEIILRDRGKLIEFDLSGELANGGEIDVAGTGIPKTQAIDLVVRGKEILAADVDNLLALPFEAQAGRIGGNLEVKIRPKQIVRLNGVANMQGVTAQMPVLMQPFARSNGLLRFRETEIHFENVASHFGAIPGVINGTIDLEKGFDLNAKTQPVSIQQVIDSLKLTKPTISIIGEVKSDIQVTGLLKKPQLSLDVATTKQTRVDRVDFRPGSSARLQLNGANLAISQFQAIPTVGGKVVGTGRMEFGRKREGERGRAGERERGQYTFDLQVSNVPAAAISQLYQTNLTIDPGLVSGNAKLFGGLDNIKNVRATGSADFRLGGGTVAARDFQFAAGRWRGELRASDVSLASLNINAPEQVRQGRLNGIFNVAGTNESFKLNAIRATGVARVAIANGIVTAKDLTLANGNWVTNLQAQGLQSDRLFANVPSQFKGTIDGNFNFAGRTDRFLDNVRGSGQGNLTLANGTIAVEKLQLANGKFQAALAPQQIALRQFSKGARGTIAGNLNVMGSLEKPTLKTLQASGELTFSEGMGAIAQPLTTAIEWNGDRLDIRQATVRGIQASGWANIATDLLGTPNAIKEFELQVVATGANIKTFSLRLPDRLRQIDYSGNLDFNGTIAGTLQSPKIEGNMALTDLQIAGLTFDRDLKGTVKSVPDKGIELNLAGSEDRIELSFDRNYQPTAFAVELDRMTVSGTRQNEWLKAEANNIQIDLLPQIAKASQLTLPNALLSQPMAGELSGNFAVNTKETEVIGEKIAIVYPRLGSLKGDRLTGDFHYVNGGIAVGNAKLQKKDSQYNLTGNLNRDRFQAEIAVSQGQIQDILETLQIFDLSDLGRGLKSPEYDKAVDLYSSQESGVRSQESGVSSQESGVSSQNTEVPQSSPAPPAPPAPLLSLGSPEAPIQEQLSRLSEIQTLLRMQRKNRQEGSPIPDLAELEGRFDGKLAINSTADKGLQANFDFQGKAWQWREFAFNQIDLKGGFHNGIVTLEPLKIQSGDSLFAFSGSVGGKLPSGQLQFANIPLQLLSELAELPPTVTFGGLLNGNVTLAGSKDNPQATGELAIANATINQTALSTTQGNFTYKNSRLDFQASSKLNDKAEPIVLQGSIPYSLPFATVKPDSDRLQLSLRVRDEGMALLNILSRDAIAWMDGKGAIALDISGRFNGRPSQLRAEGMAIFDNATIAAQVIPEAPLTEVNGKILFNFDRVDVESFTGKFSGGKIAVAGSLPLVRATPQQNPLAVTLDNLALNLKGLYQGGVQGQVTIAGSALEPDIGGNLKLFNGQVLLGESNGENNAEGGGLGFNSLEFANLKLTLGDNIQLVRPPILNFLATGSLTLNGNLHQPRPQGKITLESGQVNFFASQFRLDKGAENIAQFSPTRGLDPYLNVQLRTSATETSRDVVLTNPSSSEIVEPFTANLDSLQTVRIRARIQGYASQLANNIELTSVPPRSQREIITLLGGGFVNTLGRGDTTLGLANLAGSAVFGSFQGAVSDRLGLSELRIFSTPLISEEEGVDRDRIGVVAEAGIDLTDNISFSVLKILNADRPPQFGLQYRINNSTVIRGSSNFSDDSRAIIEYEQRF